MASHVDQVEVLGGQNEQSSVISTELQFLRLNEDPRRPETETLVEYKALQHSRFENRVEVSSAWRICKQSIALLPDGSKNFGEDYMELNHPWGIVDIDWKPKSFRSFSRLPTELRRKIWKYALPSPRLVRFLIAPISPTQAWRTGGPYTVASVFRPAWNDQANFNVVDYLLTCFEAREVFLEHYTQLQIFKSPLCREHNMTLLTTGGYIDPIRDQLMVGNSSIGVMRTYQIEFDTSKIQNLICYGDKTPGHEYNPKKVCLFAEKCTSLKKFSLLMSEPTALKFPDKVTSTYALVSVHTDLPKLLPSRVGFDPDLVGLKWEIRSVRGGARRIISDFNLVMDQDPQFWEGIKLSFALWGMVWRNYNPIYVEPKNLKYHGVQYRAFKPRGSQPHDAPYGLTLKDLGIDVPCRFDGSPFDFTAYEGVEDLFDEGVDVFGVAKGKYEGVGALLANENF